MPITFIGCDKYSENNPESGAFTLHADAQAGDIAIFFWYTRTYTKTITLDPAQATPMHTLYNTSSSGRGRLFIGWVLVTQISLDSHETWGWTSSTVANSTTIWGASIFRGVHPTAPVDIDSGTPAYWDNAEDPDAPAVTTLTDNACVIPIFGKNNDFTSIAVPTGYASAGEKAETLGTDASAGAAYKIVASHGEENPDAWDLSGGASTDDGLVWTGALKPSEEIPPAEEMLVQVM